MKLAGWLVTLGLLTGPTQVYNFDAASIGRPPAGWAIETTHEGPPAKWRILKDTTAPSRPYVLAQVSKSPHESRQPLAILDKAPITDGVVSVMLKPVAGKEDEAGGVVWRYRGPNDYYVARANALENNVAVYRVENGVQTPLQVKGKPPRTFAAKYRVPSGQWSTLKVDFRGSLFTVYFNHRRLFQVQDSTFTNSGKVGLCTKADSVTYFDDFRVGER